MKKTSKTKNPRGLKLKFSKYTIKFDIFGLKKSNFEREYKITVLAKTLKSNLPKFQTIPWGNEGVMVFSIKCSQ